jgi:hypothetical protein
MIIASRTLTLQRAGAKRDVQVAIFAPEPDGGSWKCQYEIDWPHGKWESFGAGVDAVQALTIALQKIGVEIYFSEYHKSGQLFWNKPGNGYGFPVPPSARDVLSGDDTKYS